MDTAMFNSPEDSSPSAVRFDDPMIAVVVLGRMMWYDFQWKCLLRDIVSGKSEDALPTFLGSKLYVDLRDEAKYPQKMEELLRELHNAPATTPPPVGPNPFGVRATDDTTPPAPAAPLPILGTGGWSPEKVYDSCETLLRANDVVGWRKLAKELRASLDPRLATWLQSISGTSFQKVPEFLPAADAAVTGPSPLRSLPRRQRF
jgi:hypothetical protein